MARDANRAHHIRLVAELLLRHARVMQNLLDADASCAAKLLCLRRRVPRLRGCF
jgi:hypothetical protein